MICHLSQNILKLTKMFATLTDLWTTFGLLNCVNYDQKVYQRHFKSPMGFSSCYGDSLGTIFFSGKIAVEMAQLFGVAQFQVMFAGIVLLLLPSFAENQLVYER